MTGPIDRDFRPLWDLLGALFLASCCFSSLSACFLLLRAPFLLAFELLGSKSKLPTGLRGSKINDFLEELRCFVKIKVFDLKIVF